MARLRETYNNTIRAQLIKDLDIKNSMLAPKLEKIVISVGTGFAMKDNKLMQNIADTISIIAGQRATIVHSKKSVAGFKVRENMPTGVKVTLRANRMYEFLDKLVNVSLPRMKDFRGIPSNGFDGQGNYNFGLDEQLIFPEVVYDDIMQVHGMNITFVTSTNNDKEAFQLLKLMGMPFAKGGE